MVLPETKMAWNGQNSVEIPEKTHPWLGHGKWRRCRIPHPRTTSQRHSISSTWKCCPALNPNRIYRKSYRSLRPLFQSMHLDDFHENELKRKISRTEANDQIQSQKTVSISLFLTFGNCNFSVNSPMQIIEFLFCFYSWKSQLSWAAKIRELSMSKCSFFFLVSSKCRQSEPSSIESKFRAKWLIMISSGSPHQKRVPCSGNDRSNDVACDRFDCIKQDNALHNAVLLHHRFTMNEQSVGDSDLQSATVTNQSIESLVVCRPTENVCRGSYKKCIELLWF